MDDIYKMNTKEQKNLYFLFVTGLDPYETYILINITYFAFSGQITSYQYIHTTK